jgi:hypothetical protein
MNQELPPGQSDDEIQDLAVLLAENLAKGEDPKVLTQQLVDSGWTEDDASSFVMSIQHQMMQAQSPSGGGGGGEATGWLIWIGAICGINLLSYLFGWGFWIY